ncbi:MAG: response regulator [candidate division KSB1 bacterium]|nr:response regulator [candidate division KSB1 bacterium]
MATILIVDDREQDLIRCERNLTKEGYQVLLARDGYEALKKVKEQPVDLVVLDLKLPGMDGIETLGRILEVRYDLPVILHTAYPVWKEDFRTRAADAFVIKTGDMKNLKDQIKKLLRRRN